MNAANLHAGLLLSCLDKIAATWNSTGLLVMAAYDWQDYCCCYPPPPCLQPAVGPMQQFAKVQSAAVASGRTLRHSAVVVATPTSHWTLTGSSELK